MGEGITLLFEQKKAIKEHDENRQAEIERFDLHVLRFKNEEVMRDVEWILERIKEFIEEE